MMHWVFTVILTGSLLLIAHPAAIASGGAPGSLSSIGIDPADDTGIRQRVVLTPVGGLLMGRPDNSEIQLITVHAPEVESGFVILRELARSPDELSFLITAPPSLTGKVSRITLFLQQVSHSWALHELIAGEWLRRRGHSINVTALGASPTEIYETVAYPLEDFGRYYLINSSLAEEDIREALYSHSSGLPGGGLVKALAPIALAALLLLIGAGVSRWAHGLE